MRESGDFASVAELASAERINPSYLARVLRLTLLAPAIVEAVVEERQAEGTKLERMMGAFSGEAGGAERVLVIHIDLPLGSAPGRSGPELR